MTAILSRLIELLSDRQLDKALALYRLGRVVPSRPDRYGGVDYVRGNVDGKLCGFNTSLHLSDINGCECTCGERKTRFGICEHSAALVIAYAEKYRGEDASSLMGARLGKALVRAYAPAPAASGAETPVSIVPQLSLEQGTPIAGFKIGREHKYLIKGLMDFARRMSSGEYADYGEKFGFEHKESLLDERSRRLSRLICTYASGLWVTLERKSRDVVDHFGDVRAMPLAGDNLDMIFDMFRGERLPAAGGGSWLLLEQDPVLDIRSDARQGYMSLSMDPDISFLTTGSHSYLAMDKKLYRISPELAEAVSPLFSALSTSGELLLSPGNARDFCALALPGLLSHTNVENLPVLADFMPDELEVRYYIDLPDKGLLTAQPNFSYGGSFVAAGSAPEDYPFTRRNMPLEQKALAALTAFFDPPAPGQYLYTMTDEGQMYDFLSSGIGTLEASGEVYISDRLKKLTVSGVPRPTVKTRLKGGMLELTLDTGGFDTEELRQLLACVREKRKYFRLGDGRFVGLENGDFSAFAGAAEHLDIDPAEMASRGALVPLYKGLFLDECLKRDPAVQVERGADYRRLLKDFKAYEDGDFPLPEPLEKVLREYQKTGYQWLKTLDKYGFGGILADDMGLGKTLQVLAFLSSIRGEGPALIVCPASVLISWKNEIDRWYPQAKTVLVTGSVRERTLAIAGAKDCDLLVTSYDMLRNDISSHRKNEYRVCVLDEAQYIKNHETKLFRAVKQISARTHLALSGTPVENRLSELWSLFDFVMPGFPGTYASFREKYETPITDRGDTAAQKALAALVRPFILRRMKKDVLTELPEKTEINCYIQMDEPQHKLYAAYADKVRAATEGSSPEDRIKLLSMLTRLRQICCDPALCYEDYEDASCKSDECIRLVQELTENGHRVLLFSQFTSMLSRLRERLEAEGLRTFTLQGDTPLPRRAALVQQFNEGAAEVFLISLKAGGTGLNLTGADTVIHFDPWWNLTAQNQATDRCYRIGQTKAVQVYKLITSGTIEENIVNLQYKKLELANSVTENADGGLMHMSREELLELLK